MARISTARDFSLVDAAFGPVFRYFDAFDRIADFGILGGKPKVAAWRRALAARPSVVARGEGGFPRAPVGVPAGAQVEAVGPDDQESGLSRSGTGVADAERTQHRLPRRRFLMLCVRD